MIKNRKRALLVSTIVLIVYSIVVFVLPIKKNDVFVVSYFFAVLSVLSQILIIKFAFEKKDIKSKLYGVPIIYLGIRYMITQLIVSLICIFFSVFIPIWIVWIVDVLILGSVMIGLISTDAIRDEIEHQEIKLQMNTFIMNELKNKMSLIVEQCEDKESKEFLINLKDEFRYSDPVGSDNLKAIENELLMSVSELQQAVLNCDESEKIQLLCRNISITLAERNTQCKMNKKYNR